MEPSLHQPGKSGLETGLDSKPKETEGSNDRTHEKFQMSLGRIIELQRKRREFSAGTSSYSPLRAENNVLKEDKNVSCRL